MQSFFHLACDRRAAARASRRSPRRRGGPVAGLCLGLACALGSAQAAPADPTATLDAGDSFMHYTGAGPIGAGEIGTDDTLFWFYESSGVYDGHAVNSWFVFFDPAANNGVGGKVTFANTVLYEFLDVNDLIATARFGNPNVLYNYIGTDAGLERGDKRATVFAGATMTFQWTEPPTRSGDYIRVLTAAAPVPEPATAALAVVGLAAIGALVRRRLGSHPAGQRRSAFV